MAQKFDLEDLKAAAEGTLSGVLGIEFVSAAPGALTARMAITPSHMASNGYFHAASVVTLADSTCGFGCIMNLPDGAASFTTAELKTNLIGTAREGTIQAVARMVHGGRTTQVWDAEVTRESDGKTIALFRCTQIILYSKPNA